MVVLHHLLGNAELGEHLTPVRLTEEPALVTQDPGLDQYWPVEPCLADSSSHSYFRRLKFTRNTSQQAGALDDSC